MTEERLVYKSKQFLKYILFLCNNEIQSLLYIYMLKKTSLMYFDPKIYDFFSTISLCVDLVYLTNVRYVSTKFGPILTLSTLLLC